MLRTLVIHISERWGSTSYTHFLLCMFTLSTHKYCTESYAWYWRTYTGQTLCLHTICLYYCSNILLRCCLFSAHITRVITYSERCTLRNKAMYMYIIIEVTCRVIHGRFSVHIHISYVNVSTFVCNIYVTEYHTNCTYQRGCVNAYSSHNTLLHPSFVYECDVFVIVCNRVIQERCM